MADDVGANDWSVAAGVERFCCEPESILPVCAGGDALLRLAVVCSGVLREG